MTQNTMHDGLREPLNSGKVQLKSHPRRRDRRPSVTATDINRLSFSVTHKHLDAVGSSKLAYNSRSWGHTVRMWGSLAKGAFTSANTIVVPWLLLQLLALVLVLLPRIPGSRRWLDSIPADVSDNFHVPYEVLVAFGALMSLLLAFRLNVSYERWWEGRRLWGHIIQASRSLITHLTASSREVDDSILLLRQVAGWCIAFAHCLKHHLLKSELPNLQCARERAHHDIEGLAPLLQASHLRALEMSKHPPLFALSRLRETVEQCVRMNGRGDGGAGGVQHSTAVAVSLAAFQQTEHMLDALTGCERILRTPCPPGYVGVLRAVVILWLLLVPISLASELNWSIALLPISSVISFLVLAIEEIAVEIENRKLPFCAQHKYHFVFGSKRSAPHTYVPSHTRTFTCSRRN